MFLFQLLMIAVCGLIFLYRIDEKFTFHALTQRS
jgi:hypothetical protein